MHKLLLRQIKRHLGEAALDGLPGTVCELLEAVDRAYEQADVDRLLLERSLELSSRELVLANSEMRAMFEAFPDLFFRVDQEGRILDYRERRSRAGSANRDWLIGKRIQDVPNPAAAEKFEAAVFELRRTNSALVIEYEMDQCHFEARLLPIPRNEIFVIVRDVSKRRELESKLRQSEKLSAVGQLAAGIAHEINNPLGVILGFSQSAAKKIRDNDPLSLPIRSILREALRCQSLVRHLLSFSRQSELKTALVDLNEAVQSSICIVEAQARLNAIDVKTRLEALPPVTCDRGQIQQVVINLCSNAIDSMPSGGRMVVRTALDEGSYPPRAVIEVQDEGVGISPNLRDRIFEPFFTTKDVGKGTGLGLSLVHEIVQRHGGTIEVRSAPGAGSVFTVSLPL
ncbi:MAG: PAS domain-containing protein [Elusimicrobia bacterium]|nr:PAS domain-containing protein [Elusimicrobiota bacterium]